MNLSSARRTLKQINFNRSDARPFSYSGAALVFLNIAKDAVDTFKPYKTAQHRARDLEQFYSGLQNTLKAVVFIPISMLWLIAGVSCFVVAPILGIIKYRGSGSESTTLWNEIANAYSSAGQMMSASIETLVGSLIQTLRGVTQIMTAPLTLLRIPLRDYLSQGIPEEKFQDRKSIRNLLAKADNIMATAQNNPDATANMRPILDELYRKSYDQKEHKQQVTYENKTVRVCHGRACFKNYLNANHFFKNTRTTGPILSDEITPIQHRLDEFRIP